MVKEHCVHRHYRGRLDSHCVRTRSDGNVLRKSLTSKLICNHTKLLPQVCSTATKLRADGGPDHFRFRKDILFSVARAGAGGRTRAMIVDGQKQDSVRSVCHTWPISLLCSLDIRSPARARSVVLYAVTHRWEGRERFGSRSTDHKSQLTTDRSLALARPSCSFTTALIALKRSAASSSLLTGFVGFVPTWRAASFPG